TRATCNRCQRINRHARRNSTLQLQIGDNDLSDSKTPAVSRHRAVVAANRSVDHQPFRKTRPELRWHSVISDDSPLMTQLANQPLRDDTLQCSGETAGVDAQVGEPCDRAARIVSVKRREYKMSGQ